MKLKNSKDGLDRYAIPGMIQPRGGGHLSRLCGLLVAFLGLVGVAHAQWQTQSVTLKPGWNGVYVHVDASHWGIADVAPAPIDEIWLWNRVHSNDRFMSSPAAPTSGQDWASWNRIPLASDTLVKVIGNAAYLVRNSSDSDYEWKIKGKPLPPTVASYAWTSRGVNLIGFSVPETDAPTFSQFLSPVQRLATQGEFYRYDDGDQDLKPSLFDAFFHSVKVSRGQAYWVRYAGEFNRYFGAFEMVLQNPTGIHFRDSLSSYSLRVRNHTAAELTVNLSLLPSEDSPVDLGGVPVNDALPPLEPISGQVPLLLRGYMDTNNLTFAAETFDTARQITLAPRGQSGSEVELVLGVNRTAMGNDTDALYAGILRLSDALGYTRMDVAVSAKPASDQGLWVGTAVVNQVGHYLKTYEKDADGKVVQNDDGTYKVDSTKTDLGTVAQPVQLRMILHRGKYEEVEGTRLLQRVFHGMDASNKEILSNVQGALDPKQLSTARRISAVHLPFRENNAFWDFDGDFAQGQSITATVSLGHGEHQSNPFLHTYHPDHDNLDALYENQQARGLESYGLVRTITLEFSAAGNDFESLISGEQQRSGIYTETITLQGDGEETFKLKTSGGFSINRISSIGALTAAP